MSQLALTKISFRVSDDYLSCDEVSCEDLLIGLLVLRHLKIDSRTLLESRRDILDGMDCIEVGNHKTTSQGLVGRLWLLVCKK